MVDHPEGVPPGPGVGLVLRRHRAPLDRRGQPRQPPRRRGRCVAGPRRRRRGDRRVRVVQRAAGRARAAPAAGIPSASAGASPRLVRPPPPARASSHAPSGDATWWRGPTAAWNRAAYPAERVRRARRWRYRGGHAPSVPGYAGDVDGELRGLGTALRALARDGVGVVRVLDRHGFGTVESGQLLAGTASGTVAGVLYRGALDATAVPLVAAAVAAPQTRNAHVAEPAALEAGLACAGGATLLGHPLPAECAEALGAALEHGTPAALAATLDGSAALVLTGPELADVTGSLGRAELDSAGRRHRPRPPAPRRHRHRAHRRLPARPVGAGAVGADRRVGRDRGRARRPGRAAGLDGADRGRSRRDRRRRHRLHRRRRPRPPRPRPRVRRRADRRAARARLHRRARLPAHPGRAARAHCSPRASPRTSSPGCTARSGSTSAPAPPPRRPYRSSRRSSRCAAGRAGAALAESSSRIGG